MTLQCTQSWGRGERGGGGGDVATPRGCAAALRLALRLDTERALRTRGGKAGPSPPTVGGAPLVAAARRLWRWATAAWRAAGTRSIPARAPGGAAPTGRPRRGWSDEGAADPPPPTATQDRPAAAWRRIGAAKGGHALRGGRPNGSRQMTPTAVAAPPSTAWRGGACRRCASAARGASRRLQIGNCAIRFRLLHASHVPFPT